MAWWNAIKAWFRGADVQSQPDGNDAVPEMARPAEWKDVSNVVRLLEKYGVEYALVGGYALNLNGIVRQTGDIDILVRDTPENNRRWVAAMCELPDRAAEELLATAESPFTSDEAIYGADDESGVIRIVDEYVVDILPRVCGLTYEELEPHMRTVQTRGGPIRTLDLFGLEMTKRGVRPKDIADRRVLTAALKATHGVLPARKTVSSRDLESEPTPAEGRYEFREEPVPSSEARHGRIGGRGDGGPAGPGRR